MPRLLLTNDDGRDAPGLAAFARALETIGEVSVIVPDRERSWVGKAITRFEPVTVTHEDVDGVAVAACSGFPADCVQLGVHTLFPRPDLVVSGINIGYNHGSAYLQSSGTVGAALEASIARVPAIAFSAGSNTAPWPDWRTWVREPEAKEMWDRLAHVAVAIVDDAIGAAQPGVVLNVGLPDDATVDTPRAITRVADSGYDRLFAEREPGVYVHSYGGLIDAPGGTDGTDVGAAAEGVISITPVRGTGDGSADTALLDALVG